MGARHSTSAACEAAKDDASSAFEPGGNAPIDPSLTNSNARAPIVPPRPMPQLMRPETFDEKLYRKVR